MAVAPSADLRLSSALSPHLRNSRARPCFFACCLCSRAVWPPASCAEVHYAAEMGQANPAAELAERGCKPSRRPAADRFSSFDLPAGGRFSPTFSELGMPCFARKVHSEPNFQPAETRRAAVLAAVLELVNSAFFFGSCVGSREGSTNFTSSYVKQ